MTDTKDILSSYVTSVTKKSSGRPSKYSEEFKQLLLNSQHMYAVDIYKEVQSRFPQYDITLAGLKAYMYNHNIPFKKAEVPVKNTKVKEVHVLNNSSDARRKYSLEYIDRLRQLSNCTAREMYEIAIKEFPQYSFNNRDWAKFLYSYNIDYKRVKGLKGLTKNKKSSTKENTEVKEPVEIRVEPVTTEELRVVQEQNNNRLKNIELEISNVLKKKCQQFNCDVEKYFSTEQLLDVLRNLQYLAKFVDNLCNCINSQYDIMNAYQDDILHEFEFAKLDDHNTYLQDKLNIFRNKRRDISTYKEDLDLLKQFLYTINIKELESAISLLETQKFKNQQAKYIPKVDDTLYERYNWVFQKEDVHGDNSKNSANKILRTNKYEQEQINKSSIISNKVTSFKVSCVLYGGKYKVGRCWSRTYRCKDTYTAMKWAKQELSGLINPNEGIFYKQLEVTTDV